MMTGVLTTKCSNNEKQRVGIIKRHYKSRNCVCIRPFALSLLWKLFMQRISDAIFYDNILFHVFQKHFEKFLFISDHTESDHALKQLLKGAAKKVKSGMKIQTFKMFSFETN